MKRALEQLRNRLAEDPPETARAWKRLYYDRNQAERGKVADDYILGHSPYNSLDHLVDSIDDTPPDFSNLTIDPVSAGGVVDALRGHFKSESQRWSLQDFGGPSTSRPGAPGWLFFSIRGVYSDVELEVTAGPSRLHVDAKTEGDHVLALTTWQRIEDKESEYSPSAELDLAGITREFLLLEFDESIQLIFRPASLATPARHIFAGRIYDGAPPTALETEGVWPANPDEDVRPARCPTGRPDEDFIWEGVAGEWTTVAEYNHRQRMRAETTGNDKL